MFLTTSPRQLERMLDVTMKTSSGTPTRSSSVCPRRDGLLKILYVDSLQNRGCVRARTASNCTRYDRTGGRTKRANVMLLANCGSLAAQHGDMTHDNARPPLDCAKSSSLYLLWGFVGGEGAGRCCQHVAVWAYIRALKVTQCTLKWMAYMNLLFQFQNRVFCAVRLEHPGVCRECTFFLR